jgi:Secretion system C-terminal sorting domain
LWWNADRLARAKTWYASNNFNPRADDLMGNAYRYILTNDVAYARKAINLIVALELPAGQVLPTAIGCDNCRYYGEETAIVFDWCYDQMTESERNTVMTRWAKYITDVNQQDWGGIGMEANNYYMGNLRNSILWGIVLYHHHGDAQKILDHGLNTRWQNSFIPYANNKGGKGGALGEGPEYGSTMISYPIIPFVSMNLMGRDIYSESNFFKEAVMNTIYSTTPAPIANGSQSFYGFFPYNETDITDILHERTYFGDYMLTMANYYSTIGIGQYARKWLTMTNPTTSRLMKSVDLAGTSKDFTGLPLDYYATGLGIVYGRKSWGTEGIAFQAQMKDADNVGHAHLDYGNFQLFRGGQWLTKETSGYSDLITGINGGQVDVNNPDAHNTIWVGEPGKMKSLVGAWQTASPKVTRVETNTNYTFAAVELTDCYQSAQKPEIFENPYVGKVVREYIFVRPLETLVVFDRIEAIAKKIPANNVTKMALVHFKSNPTIEDDNHISLALGNQFLRMTTLVPAKPGYTVVNEGAKGQFRLQITTSGSAQSYIINVFQGRGASDANLTATVEETAQFFNVNLSHPTLGNALISLEKGATSVGGKFGFSTSGVPSTITPFSTEVANVVVTNAGVTWNGTPNNPVTGIEDEVAADGSRLTVWPNPAKSSEVNISFTTPDGIIPTIDIFDTAGRLVQRLSMTNTRNQNSIIWEAKDVPNGVYTVKMNTGMSSLARRLVLLR